MLEGKLTAMVASAVLIMMLAAQLLLPLGELPAPVVGLAARRARPISIPAAVSYLDIVAAPIFAPDRKPGEAGVSAGGAGTLASYAALGAATGRGVATAIVSGPGNAVKTLKIGDAIDGWRLVRVTPAKLTFERGGVEQALVIGEPAEVLSKAPSTDETAGEQP